MRSVVSRSAVLLASLLLLASCRDEGAEAYARAQLQYQTLLGQFARPEDPRFDAVLADLKQVPSSSKHFASAQKMLHGIEAGRSKGVRTPLALGPNGRRPALLEAQLAACAQLAVLAGADGGLDPRTMAALEDCRLHAEKMELRFSHPEEYDGGLPP